MGRAGRDGDGSCYRLYREEDYHQLVEELPAEILRCNLASLILSMKVLGINNPLTEVYLDAPPKEACKRACELLLRLGALKNDGSLSADGRLMSVFPLDPPYARVLVSSVRHGCTADILSLVAMLSVDSVFVVVHDRREAAEQAHRQFHSSDG